MSQANSETKRVQFLLTSLIIIVILVLAVLVIYLTYPEFLALETPATQTQAEISPIQLTDTPSPTITLTPTASRTLRPTTTPSITLTPTITPFPSQTTTPPGPPTLTPAKPILGDPYKLVDWSPDHADYMIQLMADYPNTLSEGSRGENNENYYDAFGYAVDAQQESILRFPDAPLVEVWQWGLAYNLARIADSGSGDAYGRLIIDGLNQGDVDMTNLADWFKQREPRLVLYTIELDPISGYLSSYLLDVRGPGSNYILLLETSSGYQYYSLNNAFDFVNPRETRSIISDLTGDGSQEAGIYFVNPSNPYILELPAVENLAGIPPQEKGFRPSLPPREIGIEYTNDWGVAVDERDGGNNLYFSSSFYPACPVELRLEYSWEGTFFDLLDTQYIFEPAPETLSYCEFLADHAAEYWGYEPAIQLMEMLLPVWPPDSEDEGNPYPADAVDEWRFNLGIYHAQIGEASTAINYFNQVLTDPGDPDSQWVSQARDFRSVYNLPGDLYRACVSVANCNADHALDYLINHHDREPGTDIIEHLLDSGVPIIASGYFDFDYDGFRERWITVRNRPLEVLSFWIIAGSGSGEKGMYVEKVDSSKPALEYVSETEPPIVSVDGDLYIRMMRDPLSTKPYITYPVLSSELVDPFEEGVSAASGALFSGTDPDEVIEMLLTLEESPGLRCELTWTCDRYYYLLGLAYELAGRERMAVDTYLFLWWNYSRSPYTTMARLKLIGTITVTPPTAPIPSTRTPTPPTGPYPTPPTGASPLPTSAYPYPIITPTFVYPYPNP